MLKSKNLKKKTDKYCLFIASEILFNDSTIRNFRQVFRKIKISNKEDFYKSISNKIFLPGSEQFYPILFSNFDSIIDYFSDELIFIQSNFFTNYSDTYNKFLNEFNEVNSSIIKESTFLQSKEELFESLEKKKIVVLYNYFIQDNEYFIFSEDELFLRNKTKNLDFISRIISQKKIIFCTQSKINKKKIISFLTSKQVEFTESKNFSLEILENNKTNFHISNLSVKSSFSLVFENHDINFFIRFRFF